MKMQAQSQRRSKMWNAKSLQHLLPSLVERSEIFGVIHFRNGYIACNLLLLSKIYMGLECPNIYEKTAEKASFCALICDLTRFQRVIKTFFTKSF